MTADPQDKGEGQKYGACGRSYQIPSNTAILPALASRLIPTKYDSFDSYQPDQQNMIQKEWYQPYAA
jgi:hypothetical protein